MQVYTNEDRRRKLRQDHSKLYTIPVLDRGKSLLADQPDKITTKLFTHQRRALARMQEIEDGFKFTVPEIMEVIRPKGGVLCDRVGMGKTLTTLGLIASRPSNDESCKSTLVIAPKHLVAQWQSEVQKMTTPTATPDIMSPTPNMTVSIITEQVLAASIDEEKVTDVTEMLKATYNTDIVLVELQSLLTMQHYPDIFKYLPFYRVVIDECHDAILLSSLHTERFSSIRAKTMWCVTGTPFPAADDSVYGINKLLGIRIRFRLSDSPFIKAGDSLSPKHPFECLKRMLYIRNPPLNDEERREFGMHGVQIEMQRLHFTKIEQAFYDDEKYKIHNMNPYHEVYTGLRQLCCHPSCSQRWQARLIDDAGDTLGTSATFTLEEVREKMVLAKEADIKHNKKVIRSDGDLRDVIYNSLAYIRSFKKFKDIDIPFIRHIGLQKVEPNRSLFRSSSSSSSSSGSSVTKRKRKVNHNQEIDSDSDSDSDSDANVEVEVDENTPNQIQKGKENEGLASMMNVSELQLPPYNRCLECRIWRYDDRGRTYYQESVEKKKKDFITSLDRASANEYINSLVSHCRDSLERKVRLKQAIQDARSEMNRFRNLEDQFARSNDKEKMKENDTEKDMEVEVEVEKDGHLQVKLNEEISSSNAGVVDTDKNIRHDYTSNSSSYSSSNGSSNINVNQAEGEDILTTSCVICFDDNVSRLAMLPCSHHGCDECFRHWIGKHKTCPICRKEVPHGLHGITYMDTRKKNGEDDDEIENKNIQIGSEEDVRRYGTKPAALLTYIENTLKQDKDNMVIIFSRYETSLNMVSKTLQARKVKNLFCTSSDNGEKLASMVKQFNDRRARVLLLPCEHVGAGTNLQISSHLIFLEPAGDNAEHSRVIETQCLGRADRIGQQKALKAIYFIMHDTIEEKLYDLLVKARERFASAQRQVMHHAAERIDAHTKEYHSPKAMKVNADSRRQFITQRSSSNLLSSSSSSTSTNYLDLTSPTQYAPIVDCQEEEGSQAAAEAKAKKRFRGRNRTKSKTTADIVDIVDVENENNSYADLHPQVPENPRTSQTPQEIHPEVQASLIPTSCFICNKSLSNYPMSFVNMHIERCLRKLR